MFSTVPAALATVRDGKVRALGVTSTQRDPDLPNVPTIAESGYPNFEVISWQGLCTNAGAPKSALERLRVSLASVLSKADTTKRIVDLGFRPHTLSADKFDQFARAERAKWGKLVKDIGISPQ